MRIMLVLLALACHPWHHAKAQFLIDPLPAPVAAVQSYDVYPYALTYDSIPAVTLSYGGFGPPYGGVAAYSYSSRYYGAPIVWPGLGVYPRYRVGRFGLFR